LKSATINTKDAFEKQFQQKDHEIPEIRAPAAAKTKRGAVRKVNKGIEDETARIGRKSSFPRKAPEQRTKGLVDRSRSEENTRMHVEAGGFLFGAPDNPEAERACD